MSELTHVSEIGPDVELLTNFVADVSGYDLDGA